MAQYDYNENVQRIVNNGVVSHKQIWPFDYSRFNDIFSQYYDFCQENLSVTNSHNVSQPALLYFSSEDKFNAGASPPIFGYSTIRINKFVIEELHKIILHRFGKAIIEEPSEEIINFGEDRIQTIMFQTTLLFLYYHELAHLIQFKDSQGDKKDEYYKITGTGPFDLNDHIMEMDADIFASNYISKHIIGNIEENPTQSFANQTIIFSLIGVFILFLKFHEGDNTIYFQRETHPHPSIRLSVVLDSVMRELSHLIVAKPHLSHIKLDEQEILNGIGNICELRLKDYFMGNLPSDFLRIVRENKIEISEYAKFLLAKIAEHPNSVHNKLNPIR